MAALNPMEQTTPAGSFCMASTELERARRLHRSLLPLRLQNERADVACYSREHAGLGGDYGTAYWQNDTRLFLCVCDVTGHGIASALLAARINTFVRLEVRDATTPCVVIEELNRFLVSHFEGVGFFATFFCAVVDWNSRLIHYAGAGHPPALLARADGAIELLNSTAPMLGIFEEFPSHCAVDGRPFQSGDKLLLYTDGIIEAAGDDDVFYDMAGLRKSFARLNGADNAATVLEHLTADVESHAGAGGFADDVLLLAACLR